MPLYVTPEVNWSEPLVDKSGRVTPYFQRYLGSSNQRAGQGAQAFADFGPAITSINGQITTINLSLAAKAPLASPAFTGNPTAPTPSAGDNDTSIATTAFVTTHAVARATFTTWAAATGTAARTTFATYTAPTISAAYTQAEVQAIADHVQILSRRVKALIDDLKT